MCGVRGACTARGRWGAANVWLAAVEKKSGGPGARRKKKRIKQWRGWRPNAGGAAGTTGIPSPLIALLSLPAGPGWGFQGSAGRHGPAQAGRAIGVPPPRRPPGGARGRGPPPLPSQPLAAGARGARAQPLPSPFFRPHHPPDARADDTPPTVPHSTHLPNAVVQLDERFLKVEDRNRADGGGLGRRPKLLDDGRQPGGPATAAAPRLGGWGVGRVGGGAGGSQGGRAAGGGGGRGRPARGSRQRRTAARRAGPVEGVHCVRVNGGRA